MKVGDTIYCYRTGHMSDGSIFAYEGKYYPITNINRGGVNIAIISESGPNHSWNTNIKLFKEHFRLGVMVIRKDIKKHKMV